VAKKGGNVRSAVSGRFVKSGQASRSPSTTVREARGASGSSGPRFRSAITGRYVTTAHGKRSPRTTVREN
jgi:hypothetical protein